MALEIEYSALRTLDELDVLEDESSLLNFYSKESFSGMESELTQDREGQFSSPRREDDGAQETATDLRTSNHEELSTITQAGTDNYNDSGQDLKAVDASITTIGAGQGWVDACVDSDMEISSPSWHPQVSCHEQFPHPERWLISSHWAAMLLIQCAKAISEKEMEQVEHLMWVLNTLSSPQGDSDQRLASYFLLALQCKVKGTGRAYHRALRSSLEKQVFFHTAIPMLQTIREESPWLAFGQVAANAAFLEAFEGEQEVHIVDVSNWTFCIQWPTLIEALAKRPEGPPSVLRLTAVMIRREPTFTSVLEQVGIRLSKFAELMGLTLEFNVIQESELQDLHPHTLGVRKGEALAINLNQCLHYLPTEASRREGESMRDKAIRVLRSCNPKVVVVTEDEADQVTRDFVERFKETYRFVSVFLGSVETKKLTKVNLLGLDRVARLMVLNNVACCDPELEDKVDIHESARDKDSTQSSGKDSGDFQTLGPTLDVYEKREKCHAWNLRFLHAGFLPMTFSEDVVHDLHALLKLYDYGWSFHAVQSSIMLSRRNVDAFSVTAWHTVAP